MPVAFMDFVNYYATVKAIHKDIYQYDGGGTSPTAFGYYLEPTANRARGFYFDLFGGGGNLSIYQHAPSLDPNGSSGQWETNKAGLAAYIRTQLRVIDSAIYTSTENCEEGLIGSIDIMHAAGIGSSPEPKVWGQLGFTFAIVYSRAQCLFDLAIALNTSANDTLQIPSTQTVFYTTWINAGFHYTGGHLCINNGFASGIVVPTNPPTLANCPMYYTLVFIKSVIAAMNATPAIRTYMHSGFRMRPLPASWEGDYMESGQPLSSYLVNQQTNTDVYISSSVWLNPAADSDYTGTSGCLGIIITSASTSNVTYNLSLDSECYGLDPSRIKILYSRAGAFRTEVTRFIVALDYDIAITFNGTDAPVLVYEVVQT